MVGEPCEVGRAGGRRREGSDRGPVQLHPPVRGDRLLDGETGELVPEADERVVVPEHPGLETRVEERDVVAGKPLEQPQLSLRWNDRHRVEQRARALAEAPRPREHRVANRVRNLGPARGEHLRHEERIPAGLPVQAVRDDAVRVRELGHRGARERQQLYARRRGRRELAQHEPQPVRRAQFVVPVGGDDEHWGRLDPASEHPEHVESGLVRPVQILEHDDRRAALSQDAHELGEDEERPGATLHERGQLAPRLLRQVREGTQRTRREERLAAAPEDLGGVAVAVAERADERRLADTGLAAHEHEAPRTSLGRVQQQLVEE
jgi:hypothetical protein